MTDATAFGLLLIAAVTIACLLTCAVPPKGWRR